MCPCMRVCTFLYLGHGHNFGREEENSPEIVVTLLLCHIYDLLCIRLWIIPLKAIRAPQVKILTLASHTVSVTLYRRNLSLSPWGEVMGRLILIWHGSQDMKGVQNKEKCNWILL